MLKDKSELTGIIREGIESIINGGRFQQYLSFFACIGLFGQWDRKHSDSVSVVGHFCRKVTFF
jgi:hypothetical protein